MDNIEAVNQTDREIDPVSGFGYCVELPPDVPPGMTLRQWRHQQHTAHPGRPRRKWHLHRHARSADRAR